MSTEPEPEPEDDSTEPSYSGLPRKLWEADPDTPLAEIVGDDDD